MNENLDCEQEYWSRAATGLYKIGHDSIRLMRWLASYYRSYCENVEYYDLMGSVLKSLKEIIK